MKYNIISIERSSSICVKTLHTLLNCQNQTVNKDIELTYSYITDDPKTIRDTLENSFKNFDRVLLIPYGTNVDIESLTTIFSNKMDCTILLFPTVREDINWKSFKDKVLDENPEPNYQKGLEFTVTVNKKIRENVWSVKDFECMFMLIDCKCMHKILKSNKVRLPTEQSNYSQFVKDNNIKTYALTSAKTNTVIKHKCVGSIINSSGIKVEGAIS